MRIGAASGFYPSSMRGGRERAAEANSELHRRTQRLIQLSQFFVMQPNQGKTEDKLLQSKEIHVFPDQSTAKAVISVQPLERLCDWSENFGAWIDSDWHMRRRKGDCQ